MTDVRGVDFHKKRRRVTKASLTKLSTKLTELETDTTNPDALRAAQALASKLKTFDTEFKTHQLAIIDLTPMMMMAWLWSSKNWMITMTVPVN